MISLRKLLPICAMPKGGLTRSDEVTFLKLTKMPCAVSGRRYATRALVADRPDRGLEHQVELARLGEVAIRRLARMLRRLAAARRDVEMVGAKPQLAGAAVDERIREPADVTRGDPDLRVQDDRRVEQHDVLALLHHRALPGVLHVLLQQDAVVAVVERRAEPAVDVRRRIDEPAAAAERCDLLDRRRALVSFELGHPLKLQSRA